MTRNGNPPPPRQFAGPGWRGAARGTKLLLVKRRALVLSMIAVSVVFASGCDWSQWAANAGRSGTNGPPAFTEEESADFIVSPLFADAPATGQSTPGRGGPLSVAGHRRL